MSGKSKQKLVEISASKTTPRLPWETLTRNYPKFKKNKPPCLEKNTPNPVDTQLTSSNSPSTTVVDFAGPNPSVESSMVSDTLDRVLTVQRLPSKLPSPCLVSRNVSVSQNVPVNTFF